jgi:O-antigen ligase
MVMIFALFAAYTGFSLAWSPGGDYAQQKTLYIATLTFWPLIATAVIIAYDTRRLYRFLFLLALFSSWIALEAFLSFRQLGGEGFIEVLGGNYLGVGRVLGIGAITILGYYLFFAETGPSKVAALTLFGFFMALLFVVGGRGPLMATILAMLVPLLSGWRFSPAGGLQLRRHVLPLLAFIGIMLAASTYLILGGDPPTTLDRALLLYQPGAAGTAAVRLDYYADSLSMWTANPVFGHGVGSWPELMPDSVMDLYPHNIFLEIMVEYGLVGLTLFVGLLIYGWRALGRSSLAHHDPVRVLIVMLVVNTLANALVSGDIPDNRALFGMLGLMVFTAAKRDLHRAR